MLSHLPFARLVLGWIFVHDLRDRGSSEREGVDGLLIGAGMLFLCTGYISVVYE